MAACCPYYHQYELERLDESELATYELFSGHFGWEFSKRLPPSRVITFLREPTERTISALRYLRTFTPEQDRAYRDRTWVKGWVLDLLNTASNEELVSTPRFITEGNEQTRQLSRGNLPIVGHDDLKTAIDNLYSMDAFGLVEDMERSVLLLCDALGLPARSMTIRANVTARNDPSSIPSERELRAASGANVYDDELYGAAKRHLNAQWLRLLARHGLVDDANGHARLIEHVNADFRLIERGVTRLAALTVDPSCGMFADGWQGRFFYTPVQRWIRWSQTHRPCLWLPIDRTYSRNLRVEIAYTSDTITRDGATIEIDGNSVQTGRSYEIWPEDQSYHLVLATSIPRSATSPQFTEIAFRFPEGASKGSSIALSRIVVTVDASAEIAQH